MLTFNGFANDFRFSLCRFVSCLWSETSEGSSTRDWNTSLMLVDGKRNKHLSISLWLASQVTKTGYSRFGQLQRRSRFPLEDSIDENSVLTITIHVKMWRLVINLKMSSGDERRVTHVDIDIPFGRVAANGYSVLSDHVLEFARFESGDRLRGCSHVMVWTVGRVLVPLIGHFGWRSWCGFQSQECPCITIWCLHFLSNSFI